MKPHYKYIRFEIEMSSLSIHGTNLTISEEDCGLEEKNWHLPLETHRQRILDRYCSPDNPDPYYDFYSGGETWMIRWAGRRPLKPL